MNGQGNHIKLFRLFGFEVGLDPSWFIIAALVAWSLAAGLFPMLYRGLTAATYWAMGIAGTLALFGSVIVHEFCHSWVARRQGMPMQGITLFLFGGVSRMSDEPPSASNEFWMSVAGPVSSLVLAAVMYGVWILGTQALWPIPVLGVVGYLAWINFLLALFNLLPAFPLDGGRILRAALWGAKKDLAWATRVASGIGQGFAVLLIAWGLLNMFTGNVIGGLWPVLIGWFLFAAAKASYQQVLTRQALKGEPVSRFMQTDPVTVEPSMKVSNLVDDYILRYDFQMFPVIEQGRLQGCVTSGDVKKLSRESWPATEVQAIEHSCTPETVASPDEDAARALARMNQTGSTRLMVVDHDRLLGIVTLKDLLRFVSARLALEGR